MADRTYVKGYAHNVTEHGVMLPTVGYIELACGHTKKGKFSFATMTGEPACCEECPFPRCYGCDEQAVEIRTNSWEWGPSCRRCLALDESAWCKNVRQTRLRRMSTEEHFKMATHFMGAWRSECEALASPETEFWDYPRDFPLWESHTRAGRTQGAQILLVKSVRHLLYALLQDPS